MSSLTCQTTIDCIGLNVEAVCDKSSGQCVSITETTGVDAWVYGTIAIGVFLLVNNSITHDTSRCVMIEFDRKISNTMDVFLRVLRSSAAATFAHYVLPRDASPIPIDCANTHCRHSKLTTTRGTRNSFCREKWRRVRTGSTC